MQLTLTWEQIALRLLLASGASFVIGLNRDEQGHPAGMRTTMLVCLAATLAMLQVNLLLPLSGKASSSFVVMDLMRLPLGILSGIGFIGAGVIVKRNDKLVTGVTTAATMWFVTVLGLLFGGGQLRLGITASLLAVLILWALKEVESFFPREHHGTLNLSFEADPPSENELRNHFLAAGYGVSRWRTTYDPAPKLASLQCELKWRERASRTPEAPAVVTSLLNTRGIQSLTWNE